MPGVFRFAWFAVRTFFGVIALVLVAYAALWLFVRIQSNSARDGDPNAALNRVKSYNAQQAGRAATTTPSGNDCGGSGASACGHK